MISIEPFAAEHIQDAAALFISGYQTQRAQTPYLPSKYAQVETVVALLEKIAESQPGVAAVSDGKLVGYLVGWVGIPDFKGISRGVYVPEWGHGAQTGPGKTRIYQSMYEKMSRTWVGDGCFTHAITFFASDSTLRELLFWSGFGLLVVDAIRDIDAGNLAETAAPDPEIVIRAASVDDRKELARLDNALFTYLSRSPTFLYGDPKNAAGIAEAFLGDDVISIVAERDGQLLACIRGTRQKEDGCTVVRDESVMGIDFGFTEPGVRGRGIGSRVLEEVLAWGRAEQKTGCAVDFESANVLGRAFWLNHFRAVCFSAIRHIDPRVVRS
jgi:GNAT superfamily N-acetyltransferase